MPVCIWRGCDLGHDQLLGAWAEGVHRASGQSQAGLNVAMDVVRTSRSADKTLKAAEVNE